jgi:hypothetical protein
MSLSPKATGETFAANGAGWFARLLIIGEMFPPSSSFPAQQNAD